MVLSPPSPSPWVLIIGIVVGLAIVGTAVYYLRRKGGNMKNSLVCVCVIDVGTSKVAAMMADAVDESNFQILGVGISASKGLRKGVVVNPDEARETIRETVKKAEHAAGIKMQAVYVGMVKPDPEQEQILRKCLKDMGLLVAGFLPAAIASSEAVLRSDEREAGVLMADIGGGATDIAIFKEGSIRHTSVLPVGGYQLTRDIAIGLGIPFEIAEEVLRKCGTLVREPVAATRASVGPAKIDGASVGMNGRQILNQDVNDIIRARIDEMMRMILLDISRPDYASLIPSGIVLTGGVANLPGIDSVATDVFRLPVRVGIPKDVYGLADILYDPSYSTAVGLLIWGGRRILKGEDHVKNWRRLAHRAGRWLMDR